MSSPAIPHRVARRVARRWTWEHIALVWLVAMAIAVVTTLMRFPPGRPVRLLRVPPPAWRAQMGPRWMLLAADRERLLVTGWIIAPLVATAATGAWLVRVLR